MFMLIYIIFFLNPFNFDRETDEEISVSPCSQFEKKLVLLRSRREH